MNPSYAGFAAYEPGEQPREQQYVKLNTNESPFPPSPGVLDVFNKAELKRLNRYSDPALCELREAIASRHGVAVEQVSASNGSDEILAFAFMAFGHNGVAFPEISYGFYPVWARLFGLKAARIPLRAGFTIDVDDYNNENGMIVIANPNAPTGIALPLIDIARLAAARRDSVVLVDEAYVEFGGESAAALIGEYENLLIARTFSKSHSLAGARIGYAMGSREIIADIEKIRFSFNPYNVNRLSILAGAAAMRDEAYYAHCRSQIKSTRDEAARALKDMGFDILPSRANFLFIAHHELPGAAYYTKLRERGILVRRFDQAGIENHTRVTIGAEGEMARLIEATKEVICEVRSHETRGY
jgi:histidinol-phosphate aminotransferase